jgi:hypothetical protein
MISVTQSSARRPKGVCAACRREHSADMWRELALLQRMGARELSAIVVGWRADAWIEVRRCGCGAPIARIVG